MAETPVPCLTLPAFCLMLSSLSLLLALFKGCLGGGSLSGRNCKHAINNPIPCIDLRTTVQLIQHMGTKKSLIFDALIILRGMPIILRLGNFMVKPVLDFTTGPIISYTWPDS